MNPNEVKPGRDRMGRFKKGINQSLENNAAWKGDAVLEDSARDRVKRAIPALGPCESCGKQATDRHHKDGNVYNHSLENVSVLCRRCHMVADGRLERLRTMNQSPEYKWARQKGGSK